ncbi:MAG: sortase [Candidatus Dojkabacteria bacterium]|nr:sortase [Candidatus Dojkabacteria bacterium]MDQ7020755.1 sortase [Candidatus Dojkabacteria bacterium]
MGGKDKSTILIILVVLVVCFVALGVIGSIVWGLVSGPVSEIASEISDATKTSNTEYNFKIPDIEAGIAMPGSNEAKSENIYASYVRNATGEYDYNFLIPEDLSNYIDNDNVTLADDTLNDQFLLQYQASSNDGGVNSMNISIPKVGINSPIWQGLGAESLLEKGFWMYPVINDENTSEVILLCHRRHFGANDPRTCWYLDNVAIGDKIDVTNKNGQDLEYVVTQTKIYNAGDPEIYAIEPGKDRIRISTCHPLYSNQQRFVVYAERV